MQSNYDIQSTRRLPAYDSDDLLQRYSEADEDCLRLLGDRSCQRRVVAVPRDVCDQSFFVRPAAHRCNTNAPRRNVVSHSQSPVLVFIGWQDDRRTENPRRKPRARVEFLGRELRQQAPLPSR